MRMSQCQSFHHLCAVAVFGAFALEELAARRRVEVEVGHADRGAGIAGRRPERTQHAVFGADFAGMRGVCRAAGQCQARHGRNAGQPFSAKPERGDGFELIQRVDLAGGVAVQCQRQIVRQHAATVVCHPDQADAATGQFDLDGPGAGIQAVFQQFFQGRGRPFDHFTGSNLVDQVVRQALDSAHGASPVQARAPARRLRQISMMPGRTDTTMMARISKDRLLLTTGRLPKK